MGAMAGALETRTAAGWLPGWQVANPGLFDHLDAGHFPDGEMTKFEFFESLCFIDAEREAFHTREE